MNKDLSNIKKSKILLDKGECVAIPTETVYGLAGLGTSVKAANKIGHVTSLNFIIGFPHETFCARLLFCQSVCVCLYVMHVCM